MLVALALDARTGRGRRAARRRARHAPVDADEVAELRRIIDDSGAHAQVEQVIGELADQGDRALCAGRLDEHARDVLLELATAATDRVV